MPSLSCPASELLTEHEVDLTSAAGSPYLVETVGPVDTKEAEHREIDPGSDAGASLKVEGGEIFHVIPCVARLGECYGIDGGGGLEQEREVELESELAVGITLIARRSELSVLISAHTDSLGGVGIVSGHTVTSEIEGLERCLDMLVEGAEQTEVGAGHQHESPFAVRIRERGESLALEAQFPIFDPSVELASCGLARFRILIEIACLIRKLLPVAFPEEACRGSERQVDRELRAATGINGIVDR